MDYTDKKFTLDDNNTYIVVEQVDFDNNTYLYIVNSMDEDDTKFVQIKDDEILDINPNLFNNKIFPLFVEKFSK
jgi:hypothetical protein